MEWSDDAGQAGTVTLYCQNDECDWTSWSSPTITQYGTTDIRDPHCPECGEIGAQETA